MSRPFAAKGVGACFPKHVLITRFVRRLRGGGVHGAAFALDERRVSFQCSPFVPVSRHGSIRPGTQLRRNFLRHSRGTGLGTHRDHDAQRPDARAGCGRAGAGDTEAAAPGAACGCGSASAADVREGWLRVGGARHRCLAPRAHSWARPRSTALCAAEPV